MSDEETPFVRELIVENAHSADINCVKWNPIYPDILASCSDDSIIKLWKYIP